MAKYNGYSYVLYMISVDLVLGAGQLPKTPKLCANMISFNWMQPDPKDKQNHSAEYSITQISLSKKDILEDKRRP